MNRPPAASLRHWIRLFAVYLSIPITLLLCAGDLGWWQAWIYALLLVGTGVGGRLLAEQRHPGLMAERQDRETLMGAKSWDRIMAPLMALSVSYPLMVVAGLDHRYGWSPEFPLWLVVPGLLLVLLGYGFGSWGLVENRFFSSVARIQKDRGMWCAIAGLMPWFAIRDMREAFLPCRESFWVWLQSGPSCQRWWR